MNNTLQRIVTGGLWGLAITISLIVDPSVFLVLFGLFAMLSQYEYVKRLKGETNPSIFGSLICGLLVYITISLYALEVISEKPLALLFLPVIGLLLMQLFRGGKYTLRDLQTSAFSILYIILPLASLNFYYTLGKYVPGKNYQFLLTFFLIIWINDSMAYFVGKNFGKHSLYKRISPNKSWEGFFGGFISSILSALIFAHFFKALSIYQWMGFAAITSGFGVLGDLVESMLKREFTLKDSGTLLPGHGGFLDRLDSALVAAPVTLIYLTYFIL